MLVSIRANSVLPVTIVTNNYPLKDWHLMPDTLKQIEYEDCHENGKLSPAKAKLSLWKYSEYDETIYLDVDGLLLRELNFDFKYFATHVNGYSKHEEELSDINLWVSPAKVFEKYDIPKENRLAGCNSSFMAWDKKGVEVFQKALEFLKNPFPISELSYQWGKSGCQPDELYLNAALAYFGFEPEPLNVLFTRKRRNDGYIGFEAIRKFYVLCCWGGLEFNAYEISGTGNMKTGLYNKLCSEYFSKVGLDFNDHFFSLINDKIYAKAI